ncbi:MAG: ribose-phosphate pyrophosphokinase [Wenzhouxiangellaceae bacterium]
MSHASDGPWPSPQRLYSLFDATRRGEQLAQALAIPHGQSSWRRFPDGESYVRIHDDCAGLAVAIYVQLDRPDAKLPGLLFAAAQLRQMGATQVGLVAPYLPYLRHDQRFQPGEALSSKIVAGWLEQHFDWLLTVDPHLHRYNTLADLYSIPARALSAAPLQAEWLRQHCPAPLLIGPDAESEQWVKPLAEALAAPYCVLHKRRAGDRQVQITQADGSVMLTLPPERTPILVDDILSTGETLRQAAACLPQAPLCLVTHAIFADDAAGQSDLTLAGAVSRVVSCDSVAHASNAIALTDLLAATLAA